jgi:hypothetical protein
VDQARVTPAARLTIDDASFDGVYPGWAQRLSRVHWTPVAVATRAAELLVTREGTRVLDVGSGVGKLCLVGALTTAGRFHGIERVASFVDAARAAAARLGLDASFTHGHLRDLDWRGFEAFYLYNPFADDPEPLESLAFVREQLALAQDGTRVVTYHGPGAAMPPCYRLDWSGEGELAGLELWTKAA